MPVPPAILLLKGRPMRLLEEASEAAAQEESFTHGGGDGGGGESDGGGGVGPIIYLATHYVIVTQPHDLAVPIGTAASFSIVVTGIVSYQWQVSTDGGVTWANLANGGGYSGVTTHTLAIAAAGAGLDGHQYRCHVHNVITSSNSNAAELGVLQFTTQPADQYKIVGTNATFTAVATCAFAPALQWQIFNGIIWVDIPGANATTLHVNAVTIGENGNEYRCQASALTATLDSNVCTLYVALALAADLSDLIAFGNGSGLGPSVVSTQAITCNVIGGFGPYTYAWTHDSGDVYTVAPFANVDTVTFQKSLTCIGPSFVRVLSEGAYHCIVTDSQGHIAGSPYCLVAMSLAGSFGAESPGFDHLTAAGPSPINFPAFSASWEWDGLSPFPPALYTMPPFVANIHAGSGPNFQFLSMAASPQLGSPNPNLIFLGCPNPPAYASPMMSSGPPQYLLQPPGQTYSLIVSLPQVGHPAPAAGRYATWMCVEHEVDPGGNGSTFSGIIPIRITITP